MPQIKLGIFKTGLPAQQLKAFLVLTSFRGRFNQTCKLFRKAEQQPTTERESKDKQCDAAWQRRGVVSEHTIRRTTVETPILSHIKHRPARLLHRHQYPGWSRRPP